MPAEQGELVAMLAGSADAVERAEPIVASMCKSTFRCGPVPHALTTKLVVNSFLITLVTGLAETVRFAQATDVDLDVVQLVIDDGPMASDVSRVKLPKLLAADYSPQASIRDVLHNARLVTGEAAAYGIELPLAAECERLLTTTQQLGHGDSDMVAVLQALRTTK